MFHQRESNPHFLPRQNDPVIEFPSQPPPHRPRQPPPHRQSRTSGVPPQPPPQRQSRTSVEPPYAPRPQPPTQQPQAHLKPLPPDEAPPPRVHQESAPHSSSGPDSHPLGPHHSGRAHHHSSQHGHHRHHPLFLRAPTSQKTRPLAWMVAAFCALFWLIIIVGGLIILIVYLVFRPRSPRFDISGVTLNAAYLDMGYLLNLDMTVLANFTNPNTKVNVEFSYVVFDIYYERNFVTTRSIEPFSVMKWESRFGYVHMVGSQVRLDVGRSVDLQKQIDEGRVNFQIRGLFRARSKLGGIFKYSYWLYAECQVAVSGPPTGVLIGKKCVTRRR